MRGRDVPGTLEITASEDVRAFLRSAPSSFRLFWRPILGIVVYGLGSIVLGVALLRQGFGEGAPWPIGLLFIALGGMAVGVNAWELIALLRDLRANICARTTGAIAYDGESDDGEEFFHHWLTIGGHRLRVVERDCAISETGGLRWGCAEYLKHSGVVLEVRDADGTVVYRHSRFRRS